MRELPSSPAFAAALPRGTGITVVELSGLGIAGVQAFRGRAAALAGRLEHELGLRPPDAPRRVAGAGLAICGVGPGRWLCVAEGEGNRLAPRLAAMVGALGAVNDQSDGLAVLRLSGSGCRAVLARGVNIDLHPEAFDIGACATTSIAHVGATLWRRDDAGADPVFELAVPRSMSGAFLHWLAASLAGAGLAAP